MADTIGLVISWSVCLAIIGIGAAYWIRHEGNAARFGLPVAPAPEARGWWQVKGVRDMVSGLLGITLIFAEPDAVGWALLVMSLIPLGDMTLVLGNGGRKSAAYGIHGATAVLMVMAAALLL